MQNNVGWIYVPKRVYVFFSPERVASRYNNIRERKNYRFGRYPDGGPFATLRFVF